MQRVEIMMDGLIPDDKSDLAHEVMVTIKPLVAAIVEKMKEMGVDQVKQHKQIRRVLSERKKKEAVGGLHVAAHEVAEVE